jgi:hypothetical protein
MKPEEGVDPVEERCAHKGAAQKRAQIPKFEDAARTLDADLAEGFRNEKHKDQWISTQDANIFSKLGKRLVTELGPADFVACLKPLRLTKFETASRV